MPLYNPHPSLIGLVQAKPFTLLLRRVRTPFDLIGSLRTIASGKKDDHTVAFSVSNNHVFFLVNAITGTGSITLVGTSLSESTAIPISDDTEVIAISETPNQYWQSRKKWWEVSGAYISGDVSSIDYDIGVVGYPDFGNRNFKIVGYRLDAMARGNNPDFMFQIIKIQDDGDKKMSIVYLEDLGVDSGAAGNQIVDALRTGEDDRSLNPTASNLWLSDTMAVLKQGDFDTFFSNEQNHFLSSVKDEGYILRLAGSPSGNISNVDFVTIDLRYVLI